MLFRPHTFPGGALHKPFYVSYALYGRVDKVYGIEAYEERDGFAGAQGTLNVVETVGYLVYLWVVRQYGVSSRDDTDSGWLESGFKTLGFDGAVGGGWGGIACLTGFALSIMTLSKTYLYGKSSLPHISLTSKAFELTGCGIALNEIFSGFGHIGHNDPATLIFCWIIPK